MAVYTQVGEDELRAFLAEYAVGALIGVEGIAAGTENSNYKIETEQDRYILTVYEKRVPEEELPFFLLLMEHCAAAGVPCPQPVRGRDRKLWRKLCGKPAALVTYLYGKSAVKPEAAQAEAVGAALAQLHKATAGYGETRPNPMGSAMWAELVGKVGAEAEALKPGLTEELRRELDFLKTVWPTDLPQGIIHADLAPDNVLFGGGSLTGLIDFYFACTDFYAYDLAMALNDWCFEGSFVAATPAQNEENGSFNFTKGRALLRGYQSQRPLSDREVEMLPVLCRGAAMRFLSTRLYHWFHAPEGMVRRDPMVHYRRLGFHQQVKNAGEYGL